MFNAPIPPVPLPPAQPIQAPASPVSPDPETSRRVQRVQELIHNPELPGLFREAVRIFQALPPKTLPLKTWKPRKDERVRVRNDQRIRVRSNVQLAKRRPQRLQRISYVRTSARAEAESRRIQTAREVAALAQNRYNFLFTNGLNRVRLRELDEQFADLLQAEEEFLPQLPDMKDLYADFYNEMTELTKNVVCASCGCIDHHLGKFTSVSVDDASLHLLQVDPSLVPFDFKSGITTLDESHIMIDPDGIIDEASLYVCRPCQKSLQAEVLPPESLANYRWIGPVPPELQDLTWMEELLIACAHLTGCIVRLQNRNSTSHFSLKGHVILLPQDTTKLLNILPLAPSNLPDIVRVVWVGKPVRDIDGVRDYFSVRTSKVYDALVWLTQNNEDYKEVMIDHAQFEHRPPVWVAENLLDLAGAMDDGGQEDNTRIGIATEDSDNAEMAPGDVPMTASGIIDTAAVSEPAQFHALQQISLSTSDRTINILTGNNILNEDSMPSYFTSAFPTIFPWGTGKHINARRSQERNQKLEFKRWIQPLLRNSSRYVPELIKLTYIQVLPRPSWVRRPMFRSPTPQTQPPENEPNHEQAQLGNNPAAFRISHRGEVNDCGSRSSETQTYIRCWR